MKKIMMNELPGLPHVQFPMVDVRNVAEAHLQAILVPEAAGKRFILVHEGYWFMDMSTWLVEKFPNSEYKIVRKKLPKPLVWLGSLFNS